MASHSLLGSTISWEIEQATPVSGVSLSLHTQLFAHKGQSHLQPIGTNAMARAFHDMSINLFETRSLQSFGCMGQCVDWHNLIIIAMQLGRKLQWDPTKEVFTGDEAKEANKHLAREVRKPYDYSFVG